MCVPNRLCRTCAAMWKACSVLTCMHACTRNSTSTLGRPCCPIKTCQPGTRPQQLLKSCFLQPTSMRRKKNSPALTKWRQRNGALAEFQLCAPKFEAGPLLTDHIKRGVYNECSIWRESNHVIQGFIFDVDDLQQKVQQLQNSSKIIFPILLYIEEAGELLIYCCCKGLSVK